ncbi:MAG: NAD(P)/FAD-dependent oxidoreductase [Candidatus Omnitrophica bacterium]|jgi:prolycopene isomerase|nr:NAD(P)/FAD-dependent oxidoreductase [Candidatus Omnitrophota bacterium]
MDRYDVVVIGAGIGGLICGIYLANAGLKVCIIEKNANVGGYCASFTRNNYKFDIGVHYLGGIKKGLLGKILEELDLKDRIQFNQFDPADKIIIDGKKIYIRADPKETIKEFIINFPKQKDNIEKFFSFIMENNFAQIYKKVSGLTFRNLLDSFFDDYELKTMIEGLTYNIGISAKFVAAITAVILYKEYLLDPGYYPIGGMQNFPDALANKFEQNGGKIVLNKEVENIFIQNKKVKGVKLTTGELINSKILISNVDANHTFKKLLNKVNSKGYNLLKKLYISPSLFVVYLGLKENLTNLTNETCNIWSFDNPIQDSYFSNLKKNLKNIPFVMVSFPSAHEYREEDKISNKSTMQIFQFAPFESKRFWEGSKDLMYQKTIERVEKILPGLKDEIKISVLATPFTFYKYTYSKNGAAFGWLSTIDQLKSTIFPWKSEISNLFFVGHWVTTGEGQGGISKVIFSARKIAMLILHEIRQKK